jgi:hypothetical protein
MYSECDWFVRNLNQITVGFGLLVFAVACAMLLLQKQHPSVEEVIVKRVLPAFSLPAGIALVMCGFYNDLAKQLTNSGVYLSLAGMVLILTAIQLIFSKMPPKNGN